MKTLFINKSQYIIIGNIRGFHTDIQLLNLFKKQNQKRNKTFTSELNNFEGIHYMGAMINRIHTSPFCFFDFAFRSLCSSPICSEESTIQVRHWICLQWQMLSKHFSKQSLSLSTPFQVLFASPANISNVKCLSHSLWRRNNLFERKLS